MILLPIFLIAAVGLALLVLCLCVMARWADAEIQDNLERHERDVAERALRQ